MRFFLFGPRILGVRPGVSFSPKDFQRGARGSRASDNHMTGGFVYVIKNTSGAHKIGSSRDPITRIADLQTGSSETLDFAYIGVAPEGAYTRIERAAHDLLVDQKIPNVGQEWFRVPASIAIGAVIEVSNRLGLPIQQVQPQHVPEIVRLARLPDTPTKPSLFLRILGGLAGAILMAVMIGAGVLAYTIFTTPLHPN
jgi:hypothetical protein